MSDLNITKWDEKKLNVSEPMIVCEPVRIKEVGETRARTRKLGDKVKLQGIDKKSMYYQLKVCYPKDFDTIMKAKADKANVTIEVYKKGDLTPAVGKNK